jgi:hypothetical protein
MNEISAWLIMVSPDAFPLFESWGLEEMHLGD